MCVRQKVNAGYLTSAMKFDQSSVTFMHMPSLYSYFVACFNPLSLKLKEKLRDANPTMSCDDYDIFSK